MLRANNLTKHYGKTKALDAVSLSLEAGQCLAVIGPNGSGKSTLLSILAMAQKPDQGQVVIDGLNADQGRSQISYMPQDIALFEELTAEENLRCFSRQNKKITDRRIAKLLTDLKLDDMRRKRLGHLSGGQRRKVSFAVALLNQTSWLLLDEPFAGIDEAGFKSMVELLRKAKQCDTGIILNVHQLDSLSFVDHVLALEAGQSIFDGSYDAFLQKRGKA